MQVKRVHDLDRPWWFILLMVIPLLNIWLLIDIHFTKGTTGINRYGRDPLEPSTNNAKDNFEEPNSDTEEINNSDKKSSYDNVKVPHKTKGGKDVFVPSTETIIVEKEDVNKETHEDGMHTSRSNSQTKVDSIELKLEKLKSMLNKGLITEEDFNAKKQKLIDEM